jgi:hypothetical protein
MRRPACHRLPATAVLVVAGLVTGIGEWSAYAARPKVGGFEASKASQHLDHVVALLPIVELAYAIRDFDLAQTRYRQAKAAWGELKLSIPFRSQHDEEQLFDALGAQLEAGAPAREVRSTVLSMLAELDETIAVELK